MTLTKNPLSQPDWLVSSEKVPEDDRAFDVTIKRDDGTQARTRVLAMRNIVYPLKKELTNPNIFVRSSGNQDTVIFKDLKIKRLADKTRFELNVRVEGERGTVMVYVFQSECGDTYAKFAKCLEKAIFSDNRYIELSDSNESFNFKVDEDIRARIKAEFDANLVC